MKEEHEGYLQTGGEYLKLTEKAFTRSQDALGVIYELGLSVKPDPEQAVKWYRLAAEQGYAAGQIHLGRMDRPPGRRNGSRHQSVVEFPTATADVSAAVAEPRFPEEHYRSPPETA
ncbi:MAG TPA: hypothetical protein VGN53_17080 [Klebsiella sp.]